MGVITDALVRSINQTSGADQTFHSDEGCPSEQALCGTLHSRLVIDPLLDARSINVLSIIERKMI
jgi:hypothetical protein